MAESEQQQTEQQNTDVEGSGHDMQARAISTFQEHKSYILQIKRFAVSYTVLRTGPCGHEGHRQQRACIKSFG